MCTSMGLLLISSFIANIAADYSSLSNQNIRQMLTSMHRRQQNQNERRSFTTNSIQESAPSTNQQMLSNFAEMINQHMEDTSRNSQNKQESSYLLRRENKNDQPNRQHIQTISHSQNTHPSNTHNINEQTKFSGLNFDVPPQGSNIDPSSLEVIGSSSVRLSPDPQIPVRATTQNFNSIELLGQAIGGGGVPGIDYTILSGIPETGFLCGGRTPGYYADVSAEARCQLFHICQEDGRQDSFLCPNGTVFNQEFFVCDWWYNFDCSTAESYFNLNENFGRIDNQRAHNSEGLVHQRDHNPGGLVQQSKNNPGGSVHLNPTTMIAIRNNQEMLVSESISSMNMHPLRNQNKNSFRSDLANQSRRTGLANQSTESSYAVEIIYDRNGVENGRKLRSSYGVPPPSRAYGVPF